MKPLLQQLVLGSASPRRQALIQQLLPAIELSIFPVDIDESLRLGETGLQRVMRLSASKMDVLPSQYTQLSDASVVLTADTEVVLGDQPLGKPESEAQALENLQRLSGQAHQVLTGLVIQQGNARHQAVVATQVRFRDLSREEMQAYVAIGEYQDKAGGYAIQGQGAALVAEIQGSYSNVVGLPLETLAGLLDRLGYRVF